MCAVPNMAVFCSSLISCFPGTLLRYFLNDFETVPVAHIITGTTFVFTFHIHCTSTVTYLYFRIFSASFSITFLSPEIVTLEYIIIIIIIIIIHLHFTLPKQHVIPKRWYCRTLENAEISKMKFIRGCVNAKQLQVDPVAFGICTA